MPFSLAYSTTEATGLIIDGDHRQRDFTWDFENGLRGLQEINNNSYVIDFF
jgi:hypothetical protein